MQRASERRRGRRHERERGPMMRRDRRGALEGMPLYLIILVVVAAASMAVVVGWVGAIDAEQTAQMDQVVVDKPVIYAGSEHVITVKVLDDDGHYMTQVAITVSGAGVSPRSYVVPKGESEILIKVKPVLSTWEQTAPLLIEADGAGGQHAETTVVVTANNPWKL